MILIVGTCMGFNMILKFLSLFYVLHLNTSLRLAYYKHVKKATLTEIFDLWLIPAALELQYCGSRAATTCGSRAALKYFVCKLVFPL